MISLDFKICELLKLCLSISILMLAEISLLRQPILNNTSGQTLQESADLFCHVMSAVRHLILFIDLFKCV